MHWQKTRTPGSGSPSKLAALLAALVAVLALAACGGPAQGTTPAPTVPTGPTTASRQGGATDTATVRARTSTPAATTGKPKPAPTTVPAAKPQPVPGLTIPTPPRSEGLATVAFDRLPAQAQDTIRLIARDGPFPYRQDGITFENRERVLPQRPGGYYKEYTVETPGSPDRGARRIVAGQQGELYYTDDHYATFRRVVP